MRRILLPLAAAALFAGCTQNTRSDTLTSTLSAYASAVRWDGMQSSQQFVDPAVLKAHPLTDFEMRRYQQLRVTDYDDGTGPAPLSDTEVQQTVKINFVNVNTQVERSIVVRQVWHYDTKTRHWWLESGMPDPGQH